MSKQSDPFKRIQDKERKKILKKAITQLAPHQRRALELQVYESRSCREIAKLFGWGEVTTRVILHNARQKIRQHLMRAGVNL